MKVGKTFTFDAAHRLQNHEGKCKNLHGHTYKVDVVIEAEIVEEDSPADGMVIDFADLKSAWLTSIDEYLDHATLLEASDPLADLLQEHAGRVGNSKVQTFDFPPTAENIANWIHEQLQGDLDVGWGVGAFSVDSVRVWETPTSWAES